MSAVYRSLLCTLLLVFAGRVATAQDLDRVLWTDVAEASIASRSSAERVIVPTQYRTLRLDRAALAEVLAAAPQESRPGDTRGGVRLPIPMPDGSFLEFEVVEASIMAPGLQARYPSTRSYLGRAIDRPGTTVRLTFTPKGFHAMVLSPQGTRYVDPYYARGDRDHYIAYARADYPGDPERLRTFFREEGDIDPQSPPAEDMPRGISTENGTELRTYRLALAATGEYSQYHISDPEVDDVEEVLAEMVVAMTRVNAIYERDVAVRMELVEGNDTLIFLDGVEDPYTNNNGSTMLGQNQATVDALIGPENYDIGHVFSTGGGGIAGLGVVCVAGNKARGVTGLGAPIGDPFYVDYVSHEMGHQFRANHTFNASTSGCLPHRSAATAYEPGSGSTIMSYAGLCLPQNVQNYSDDYFHAISLQEIVTNITNGAGSSCGTVTETGNEPPVVEAETALFIPIGTPFTLTGTATDDEDPAALTYVWEEMDLAPAGPPPGNSQWAGDPPFFRTFLPTGDPTRVFPRFDAVLSNNLTPMGEGLPSSTRTLRFRLTVRDNNPGAGGIGDRQIIVTTDENAGPFVVTFANEDDLEFGPGTQHDVTWDVAGTDGGSVDAQEVDILFSDNGGESFDYVLAAATPNDGSETITFPDVVTDRGRIMIRATEGIFFAVNEEEFALAPGVAVEDAAVAGTHALSAVYPNPLGIGTAGRATVNVAVEQGQTVQVTLYDALGREVRVLYAGPLAAGQNRQIVVDGTGLAAGPYFVRATGETFTDVRRFTVVR